MSSDTKLQNSVLESKNKISFRFINSVIIPRIILNLKTNYILELKELLFKRQ
jgi:hypothetical protein